MSRGTFTSIQGSAGFPAWGFTFMSSPIPDVKRCSLSALQEDSRRKVRSGRCRSARGIAWALRSEPATGFRDFDAMAPARAPRPQAQRARCPPFSLGRSVPQVRPKVTLALPAYAPDGLREVRPLHPVLEDAFEPRGEGDRKRGEEHGNSLEPHGRDFREGAPCDRGTTRRTRAGPHRHDRPAHRILMKRPPPPRRKGDPGHLPSARQGDYRGALRG